MAICIEIKKLKSENNKTHWYSVSTKDFGEQNFTIKIDVTKKVVHFYENDSSSPFFWYNFEKTTRGKVPPQFEKKLITRVLIKADQALKENNFPEHIGFAA